MSAAFNNLGPGFVPGAFRDGLEGVREGFRVDCGYRTSKHYEETAPERPPDVTVNNSVLLVRRRHAGSLPARFL